MGPGTQHPPRMLAATEHLQFVTEMSNKPSTLDSQTPDLPRLPGSLRHPLLKVSIEPPKPWLSVNFRELWEAREVLYYLTWRDIKVRYKQSALGAAWILIQPLLTLVIFSIFFGRVARMPSDGVPYPIFMF